MTPARPAFAVANHGRYVDLIDSRT
jgi:hypothetical protein